MLCTVTFHDVNMASSRQDGNRQDDSQLLNYFNAEIILQRKDDDRILLCKCSNEDQWELPRFILKENESFRNGIQRWSSNQLGKDVHLNLHGVAGIKHCINDKGRTMTLIFYVSCVNCHNVISEADRDLEDHTVCEQSSSNIKHVESCGSMSKWFSDSEACSDAIKDDVCNWIKKALGQELVVLDVSEEFTNFSSVQEEATPKESYKRNVINTTNVSNSTCTTGLQCHQKLCKVSIGENVSLELGQLAREQNTGGVMLKDNKNSHKPQKDDLGSVMEKLVESAHFGKLEKEFIKKKFDKYSQSEKVVKLEGFSLLMKELGVTERFKDLFRAFDFNHQNQLTYQEVLFGVAAMDPSTPHGGPSGELRCRYLFKFYSSEQDAFLSFEEFKLLIKDIQKLKGESTKDCDVLEEARSKAKLFGSGLRDKLSLVEFLETVGSLRFRGTSVLFRLPVSIIKLAQDEMYQCLTEDRKPSITRSKSPVKKRRSNDSEASDTMEFQGFGFPFETVTDQYELATHTVKVRRSGMLSDVSVLWDMNNSNMVTGSAQSGLVASKLKIERLPSINCFNKQSDANQMLSALRYFERAIKVTPNSSKSGGPKGSFSWGLVEMPSLGNCLVCICRTLLEIIKKEPRLIRVKSPTYIVGDLHGNFRDLVCFEKVLWRMGPVLTPASFMFLGDYVDRGENGVEVVAYLFAQKILAPSKFFLIRGNHEIRDIQKMFTFHSECIQKFGAELGEEVWGAVNAIFDVLPLAAIVDNKIFCVHGGIPLPSQGGGLVSSIDSIPSVLCDPEKQSDLAWELMWGDPLR
ncbi:hypothetical protein ACROYT_G010988 [Oculina patagonica]